MRERSLEIPSLEELRRVFAAEDRSSVVEHDDGHRADESDGDDGDRDDD